MQKLPSNRYHLYTDGLSNIPFNTLFAKAVLDQKVIGIVFVNNIKKPTSFFISHPYGMSLLFGNTNDSDFNNWLIEYLLNINRIRKNTEWLQVYPERWNDILHQLLNNKIVIYENLCEEYTKYEIDSLLNRKNNIIQWNRINFQFDYNANSENTDVHELRIIDKKNYDLINGHVIPKYFWKSKTYFLSNGIGYILLNNGEFVSTAFSAFIDKMNLEIGVETADKFRKNGFAQIVCNKLLDYCKQNNYKPIWACRKENIASYNLAISLGFKEITCIPYYELII